MDSDYKPSDCKPFVDMLDVIQHTEQPCDSTNDMEVNR